MPPRKPPARSPRKGWHRWRLSRICIEPAITMAMHAYNHNKDRTDPTEKPGGSLHTQDTHAPHAISICTLGNECKHRLLVCRLAPTGRLLHTSIAPPDAAGVHLLGITLVRAHELVAQHRISCSTRGIRDATGAILDCRDHRFCEHRGRRGDLERCQEGSPGAKI